MTQPRESYSRAQREAADAAAARDRYQEACETLRSLCAECYEPVGGSHTTMCPVRVQQLTDWLIGAEKTVESLREALQRIADTPGVEMVGTGRDRHGNLNGHEKCVQIAREALK